MTETSPSERMPGPDLVRWWRDHGPVPGLSETLNYHPIEVGEGKVRFRCAIDMRHANMRHTVHGGVMAVLVDTATGASLRTILAPGEEVATTDLDVKFLRALPIDIGEVFVNARIINKGRTSALAEAQVVGGDDTLYAWGSATMRILRGK